jgi:hypothetical protein
MVPSEFEKKKCEKLVGEFVEKRRPSAHDRKELDLEFRVLTAIAMEDGAPAGRVRSSLSENSGSNRPSCMQLSKPDFRSRMMQLSGVYNDYCKIILLQGAGHHFRLAGHAGCTTAWYRNDE